MAAANMSYRQVNDSPHWPPPVDGDESPLDTMSRLENEKKAKAVSDEIDKLLAVEKQKRKKKGKESVRILLLGQAESGKSTTLKNFQLQFAPRAFYSDADSWRTVIYLNLVRSVNFILDLLSNPPSAPPRAPTPAGSPNNFGFPSHKPSRSLERPKTAEQSQSQAQPRAGPSRGLASGYSSYPLTYSSANNNGPNSAQQAYSPEIRRLKLSLAPLRSIEATLNKRLATIPRPKAPVPFPNATFDGDDSSPSNPAPSSYTPRSLPRPVRRLSLPSALSTSLGAANSSAPTSQTISPPTSTTSVWNSGAPTSEKRPRSSTSSSSSSSSSSDSQSSSATSPPPSTRITHHKSISHLIELAVRVRSNSNWKRLARLPNNGNGRQKLHPNDPDYDPEFNSPQQLRDLESARAVIEACGEDMHMLWHNGDVQSILARAGVALHNEPGFFLNDALRITASDYVPDSSDILRARLCTIGVEEHRIKMETSPEAGEEWVIYDVGGSRSQRAVWAPFFDNVNAIIFLAPISAFDEKLAEDPSVNRLQDTVLLWRAICTNRLLRTVEIILFLNKCDVLKAKLRSGIRFAHYCTTYDDHDGSKNDAESVARYVLSSFHAVHKQCSPRPRKLHAYLTSVVDSRATSKVLGHVRELVMVGHLTEANVL